VLVGLPFSRPRLVVVLRAVVFAAAGLYMGVLANGVGFMTDSLSSASAYEYGHKVVMCHNGHEILVDDSSVKTHLRQGDTLGPCP
jgi:hypothetical protein